MDYITAREAAEKWGVSERRINQYCAEGRIPGAERFGGAWAIPAGAEKPGDPRKQKTQTAPPSAKQAPELFPGFMPLMNTPFRPGSCKEAIARMEAGPKKDIALAEYHYFSGQAEKAMQETEGYLTAADGGIRLSACLLFAYACLSMGRIDHARNALGEIRRTLASGGETDPAARAMEAFVAFAAAVLLHLPLPEEMPPAESFLPLLPPGLRAFALYVQAHYLYLKEDYANSPAVYNALSAVENGNTYTLISHRFYSTNVELALANCYQVASVLFPGQFEDVDPVEKLDEICRFLLDSDACSFFKDDRKVSEDLAETGLEYKQVDVKAL